MDISALAQAARTQVLTKAALAADAGSVTTYSTTGTMLCSLNGNEFTKAAVTNGATPTTDANTGAAFVALIGGGSVANTPGQGTIFLWMVNSSGTVKVAQSLRSPGLLANYPLDMQGNFTAQGGKPNLPPVPEGYVPFAIMTVRAGATASASGWIFGTNNWNAAGITVSIQDINTLPSRL